MATVFAPPAHIPLPVADYKNYDHVIEMEKEDDYVKQLAAYLRTRKPGKRLVGEIIRHQVADGYAQYMISSENPFQLVHLPLGDGYSAGAIWERGIRLTDAKNMIERDKAMAALFSKKPEEHADAS